MRRMEVENVQRTLCQLFLYLQRVKSCSDSRDENIFVECVCCLLWSRVLVPREVDMFDKFMISLTQLQAPKSVVI